MKERELGSMQVAGETIRIVETIAPFQNGMVAFGKGHAPLFDELPPLTELVCRWSAIIDLETMPEFDTSEEFLAAEGTLVAVGEDPETVGLQVSVYESKRRLGLGRFMIRLGTDQAIRYRKRTILAEVANDNEVALKILDEEDFEKQPEAHAGFTLMKKELKWT